MKESTENTAKLERDPLSLEQMRNFILAALMTPLVKPGRTRGYGPDDPRCRWGLPVLISGPGGIGKSMKVAEVAAAVKLPFQKVFVSHKQPDSFEGAIVPTTQGLVIECILPQARELMKQGHGVLFLDELHTATPIVQKVALGVVDERRIGDHELPKRVRIMAAMNPPEYSSTGFDIDGTLMNRMAKVQFTPPTAEEWIAWLSDEEDEYESYEAAEKTVVENWGTHWPVVRALVMEFIRSHQDALNAQPKAEDPASSEPWASSRTWFYGSCAMTAARCLGMPRDTEYNLLFSTVGTTHEDAWIAWVDSFDVPAPEAILTSGWTPNIQRIDVAAAATHSVRLWFDANRKRPDIHAYAVLGYKLQQRCMDVGLPDLGATIASCLAKNGWTHTTMKNPEDTAIVSSSLRQIHEGNYGKLGT